MYFATWGRDKAPLAAAAGDTQLAMGFPTRFRESFPALLGDPSREFPDGFRGAFPTPVEAKLHKIIRIHVMPECA